MMGSATMIFETSESTAKLDAALANIQAEMQPAKKTSFNPHFKTKYADLAECWDACREVMTKHGVNVTQWPLHSADGKLHLMTRVAVPGEWMRATLSIPVSKQDPQGYAAAATYAKRIGLTAALGISADFDDDGNEASGIGTGTKRTTPPPKPPAHDPETGEVIDKPNGKRSGAEAWVRQQKFVIGKCKTREELQAWEGGKGVVSAMDKLWQEHPDLSQELRLFFNEKWDTMPAGGNNVMAAG